MARFVFITIAILRTRFVFLIIAILRGCRSLLEIVFVGQCEVFVCLGFGHFILFVYIFPWPRSS